MLAKLEAKFSQTFFSLTDNQFFLVKDNELVAPSLRVPIENGIPRFVNSKNYASAFGNQWNKFQKTQLDSHIGFTLSKDRLFRCIGSKNFATLKGKRVLEAGCGAGRFTEVLLNEGCEVISIDISTAVDANQSNFPQNEKHLICQADINNLPFPPESFDMVLCLGVIQHTPSTEQAIKSLFRHVKPGGILVIDHYRRTLSFLTRFLPIYRFVLKFLRPSDSLKFSEKLVDLFLPIHKRFCRNLLGYAIVTRFSPIVSYYHAYPQLSSSLQREWSILDTHDSLFDHYKRLKTISEIESILKQVGGQNVECWKGGIGIEARCTK
jgi:2-polyprenyl-3-methyl-5-hydroxy-6-metoxy-1,4-benzoquinol methylase